MNTRKQASNFTIKSLLVVILSTLILHSCTKITGEGPVVAETRNTVNFTSLAMRLPGNVYLKQDSVYHIEIRAQRNILDIIETTVINRELVLRIKNNYNVRSHEDITVNISAPVIEGLSLSGSGNLYGSGLLNTAGCNLEISGSGNINLDHLVATHLEAGISGSGNIKVSEGKASSQQLRISGSGNIDLVNLPSKTSTSTTSGSGTIRVNVSERLDAKISGSGNVYYKGAPVVSASISGSGKLVPL